MTKQFVPAALLVIVAELAVAAFVVASGVVDVAARPSPLDGVLAFAAHRSIAHHALSGSNPRRADPAALTRGLAEYRALCAACHGGAGEQPAQWAGGMHPSPPDLSSPGLQSLSDGALREVITDGIGSTGMPAFGGSLTQNQVWSLVAAVRSLSHSAPVPTDAGSSGGGSDRLRIEIANMKYVPADAQAHQGDTVEWHNADLVAHTATADDHSFDTGPIAPGEIRSATIAHAGATNYTCEYHSAMHGTIDAR